MPKYSTPIEKARPIAQRSPQISRIYGSVGKMPIPRVGETSTPRKSYKKNHTLFFRLMVVQFFDS